MEAAGCVEKSGLQTRVIDVSCCKTQLQLEVDWSIYILYILSILYMQQEIKSVLPLHVMESAMQDMAGII